MHVLDVPRRLVISDLAYERLLKGEIPEAVAATLKTNVTSLQNLVDGSGSFVAAAAAMGCAAPSVEELRRHIGRDGAIGVVIGLAVAARLRAEAE